MASGNVQLPLVGAVHVAGLNLLQVQEAITKAYRDKGQLNDPLITVTIAEKSMTTVGVYGEVKNAGPVKLPKGETDVGHALIAAGGLLDDAGMTIEVHRRRPAPQGNPAGHPEQARMERTRPEPNTSLELGSVGDADAAVLILAEGAIVEPQAARNLEGDSLVWSAAQGEGQHGVVEQAALHITGRPVLAERCQPGTGTPFTDHGLKEDSNGVLRIPLRGLSMDALRPEDVILNPGDTLVVPSRKDEVFYVVGKLSPLNFFRLTQARELGGGFLLPRDREIDVLTAVVMAGYIDPIDSPTHVTVQRQGPDGEPLLIKIDLIRSRHDRRENLIVQAGDIIYLDPDSAWWIRRTFDRIIGNLFVISFRDGVVRR
jgi:protein involved in polysaccharide export with SLBB domain